MLCIGIRLHSWIPSSFLMQLERVRTQGAYLHINKSAEEEADAEADAASQETKGMPDAALRYAGGSLGTEGAHAFQSHLLVLECFEHCCWVRLREGTQEGMAHGHMQTNAVCYQNSASSGVLHSKCGLALLAAAKTSQGLQHCTPL